MRYAAMGDLTGLKLALTLAKSMLIGLAGSTCPRRPV